MSTVTTPDTAVTARPRGLRAAWERFAREPNAIWMREMRQSARLGRTPWVLFTITLAVTLLMTSIGGIAASENASPAVLGGALYQVFFSIGYLVVTLIGPTVAANGIAAEREGRTWEAVLLTGLTPKAIARGKFLAAYTTIALYIVVLAPVGALSFLFGGVTATQVVVAFAYLFAIAALSVAFGLAVSSLTSSLRGALVITLLLAVVIGPSLYFLFGFAASFGIHRLWPSVPDGLPIWLPLAYERASFGKEYVLLLVVVPLLLMTVPAWFLYEVTIANLTGETDDRSTGLKRWFFVCTPLLALASTIPSILALDDEAWVIAGILAFAIYGMFCTLLFASEPPGPPRRVRVRWERARASAVRRFFGPGLMKASVLVAVLGVAGMIGITVIGVVLLHTFGTPGSRQAPVARVVVFAAYAVPFYVFVVGLVGWLRAGTSSAWITRVVCSGILFLIAAVPWVVAAIGGVLSRGEEKAWLAIGAPSPIYAGVMVSEVTHFAIGPGLLAHPIVPAGLVCAAGWGLLGLILLAMAARRSARRVAEHDAAVATSEAALHAEDVAADTARAPHVAAGP